MNYGWKPSPPDFHDVPADPSELTILSEVDPRGEMPACYNQGNLGSCTANAVAGALQYNFILDGETFATEVPSRLFIYYMERVREGTVNSDAGAWGRDGFKVLRKTGAPPESIWPYDISKFRDKPDDMAYREAGLRKIEKYVHPGLPLSRGWEDRKDAFKRLLSNKQTIAFGFTVFESFEQTWNFNGKMPFPQPGEKVLGGHEVLLVGYLKDEFEYALVRNSWGTNWGMDGYFLMPWEFLCDPSYSADWRSIYRPKGA